MVVVRTAAKHPKLVATIVNPLLIVEASTETYLDYGHYVAPLLRNFDVSEVLKICGGTISSFLFSYWDVLTFWHRWACRALLPLRDEDGSEGFERWISVDSWAADRGVSFADRMLAEARADVGDLLSP